MKSVLTFSAILSLLIFISISVAVPLLKPSSVRRSKDHSPKLMKSQLERNEKSVHEKLEQLHVTIDALKKTVSEMNAGHSLETNRTAERMKAKFQKLSAVIRKQTLFNNLLFDENKRLRSEKSALVTRITLLKKDLVKQAETSANSTAEAWFRNTADELKQFLFENGLEHFASPNFSPIVAGLVSNGVVIVPLTMTSIYLVRHGKQLNALRMLMALNLFDLGFASAVIVSSVLLLGDPLEGMRHISEVNFVFIQFVIGAVFWLTVGFLVAIAIQNKKNRGGKYALVEVALRLTVALDYTRRVWSPVIDRDDVAIALPVVFYAFYFISAIVGVKLTKLIMTYSSGAYWHVFKRIEDIEPITVVVPNRARY